ncbi:MAG: hypothetical protein D6739_03235 [Nitrospirae bacterium]|nr:MAG: hypothetical protein D6739_03235 [Nitrospirota bacterium]
MASQPLRFDPTATPAPEPASPVVSMDLGPGETAAAARPPVTPQQRRMALVRGLQNMFPNDPRRPQLLLELSAACTELGDGREAWAAARDAFDLYLAREDWEGAARAADALFLTGEPEVLKGLAHGLWLAVTFPIDPRVTLQLLERLIDEAAHDDIAAVAAATAHYVAYLRAGDGELGEEVRANASRLLSNVAWTHGGVETREGFEGWVRIHGLDDPEVFLPLLAQALDRMVEGDWWYDRDALRARIPEEGPSPQ